MDKNQIVELIKENRLQEALKVVEQASKNSHLHKDVIMLSSSYAEYSKLNRNATQDFQTLEIQRARITDQLLSVLEELSPSDMDKISAPRFAPTYQGAITPDTLWGLPKRYVYIGGAVLLILLLYFFLSPTEELEPTEEAPIHQSTQQY
jgi:hypothetical protein